MITNILRNEYFRKCTINKKRFYLRRFLRLTPNILACILLFVSLSLIYEGEARLDVVAIAVTYTANYARALFYYDLHSLSHFWSLAVEEQYYLVWPMVIAILERCTKNNANKFLLLLLLASIIALYRAAMVGTYGPGRIYFALDTHMDGLVMGSAIAYLYAFMTSTANTRLVHIFNNSLKLLTPLSIIALLLVMYFMSWRSPWMGRLGYTLVAISSSIIILDLVLSPVSWLRSVFELNALAYVGRISYGLYVYHYPIFHFSEYFFKGLPHPIQVMSMLVLTFAVAMVSYHFFERYFLQFKARLGH